MTSLEIFAGAGGLALGVTESGFSHAYLVEWDKDSAKTLNTNSGKFDFYDLTNSVFNGDIHSVDFKNYEGKIDLLSGGLLASRFQLAENPARTTTRGICFPRRQERLAR